MNWSPLTPLTPQWLRRVRRWIYALAGVFAVFGMVITWWSAVRADLLMAVAGAITTLCALGAALVWSTSLRLGISMLRDRRRLERLEHRVATGSPSAGRRRSAAPIMPPDRISALIARVERFCDVQESQAARLEGRIGALESATTVARSVADAVSLDEVHWADDDSPPGERTMAAYTHLIGQASSGDSYAGLPGQTGANGEKQALRLEFAAHIHQSNYGEALATGDEIVNRYPDSKAADDFRRVRPHLVRKIQLTETARRSRG